jgi:hypothetical protein
MKRSKFIVALVLLVAVVAMFWPRTSPAIPAFARENGFTCTMCHSTYPRLNDFGVRFRANGYQVPGKEDDAVTIFNGPPPFAFRTSGGYTNDSYVAAPMMTDTRQFQLNGLDILAGGVFKPGVGFFAVYVPQIDASNGGEGQTGELEAASVVFTKPGTFGISLRAGRFEPEYVVFSNKRHLSVSPYEIYEFGAPGNLAFSQNQTGIEVAGRGHGFIGAAGFFNGSDTNQGDDAPTDAYVRLAAVLGGGEGQSAGQRIGFIGYYGRARPSADILALTTEPARRNLSRVGADVSLNWQRLNLSAQYLYGQDEKELWGAKKDQHFSGGFAELTVDPIPDFALLARYDWVDSPGETDIVRWTGGLRYYLVDNLALHLEYSQRRQNQKGEDMAENFYTLRLDYAF